MIIDLVTFIVLGVMTGGLYALLGLSLTLIFGVMRVINVAHGEMLTLGAYTAVMLGAVGLGGVLVPVAAAILVVTFVGLIIARVLIRPLTVEGRVHEQRAHEQRNRFRAAHCPKNRPHARAIRCPSSPCGRNTSMSSMSAGPTIAL